ncbi:MAG: hypothetical protein K6D59_01670 [Bacteroidales bacterium]|nr:hypothetical protein [Bacteroidales bacterium]
MKAYRILLFLATAAVLSSCGQKRNNSAVDSDTTTIGIMGSTVLCQKDYHLEPVIHDTLFGYFISPKHIDTLIFKYYSSRTNRLMDSIAIGNRTDMDAASWFYEQGIGIRIYLPNGILVHTQPDVMGMICAIPLDNLLPAIDALAIVWYPRQASGIMPCRIVSIEDGQWTEIGSFYVNTNLFPDTLTPGIIDGFLERKKGVWMYRDYEDQMQWMEEHDGECPMKPLKNKIKENR